MDTRPMPLETLAATHGGLHEFRLTTPTEITAMLKRLIDGNVTVVLNAPDGSSVAATLWTIDSARSIISFSANADDPQLRSLIEFDEAVVVGYLDSVKLQFDVQDLVLVHGGKASALNCAFPREMFRFQRRSGYRVRPLMRSTPVARLRHPMIPDMQLALRVLDVSIGGCALFIPDDVPPLDPGVLMNGVEIDLDADTRLHCALRLQHITSINPESRGARLGCEMLNAGSDGLRALQRYIDQTQKRRRLMALD
ncbi:flagellar brake protein [Piscinibacter sp.]|uniref:flagellar brake protein n=1 Tax=Piscinibacter sp. TaxID=1903157 RepID=UPI00355A0263